MSVPDLDIYGIAFLAGGLPRTVDAAVVALVLDGRLRVHSPGQLASVDLSRRHPVEGAVLDACPPIGHRSVDTICWRLADDDRLLDIGRRLRKAHLLGILGAPTAALHGDHRRLVPTRAGRHLLRDVACGRAPAAPEVGRVALGGRKAMADHGLRAAIFDRPVTTLGPVPGSRFRHDIDHSDPKLAAYRTPSSGAYDRAAAIEALYRPY